MGPSLFLALAAFVGMTNGSIGGQETQTVAAGVYTTAQAQAGQTAYGQNCAGCHLSNFRGSGDAPAVAGPDFTAKWGPRAVNELFTYLVQSMPPTNPGLLGETGTEVRNYVPVTAEMLKSPPRGDWLMFRGNYQGHSYTSLNQITPANVKNLKLQWVRAMNDSGANQTTPIVHNGVTYLASPSNFVQALDGKTVDLICSATASNVYSKNKLEFASRQS